MLRAIFITSFFTFATIAARAQSEGDSTYTLPKWDYQIYLKQPAKEIKQLLNYKTCEPINGQISDTKKTVIMKDYEPGTKVYVIILYEDGTEDEFVRSPCFIDPVIL